MKQAVDKLSELVVRRDFPIADRVAGWFFRIHEVSAGAYRVDGTDLWGRTVSRTGTDPDALIIACEKDAKGIEAQVHEDR